MHCCWWLGCDWLLLFAHRLEDSTHLLQRHSVMRCIHQCMLWTMLLSEWHAWQVISALAPSLFPSLLPSLPLLPTSLPPSLLPSPPHLSPSLSLSLPSSLSLFLPSSLSLSPFLPPSLSPSFFSPALPPPLSLPLSLPPFLPPPSLLVLTYLSIPYYRFDCNHCTANSIHSSGVSLWGSLQGEEGGGTTVATELLSYPTISQTHIHV